jgi:hypothetical protein
MQNKYLWRCLDILINPLRLIDCNGSSTQKKFSFVLLHQSYDVCKNPVKIYGPELTVLSWDKENNTVSMSSLVNATNTEWCYDDSNYEESFTIHPFSKPKYCLSAPLKDGDPVTVIDCVVDDTEKIMGISWSIFAG